MSPRDRIIIGTLAALALLAALGLAGEMDMQDEQRQLVEYCDNVTAGVWPDYQGNAAQVCPAASL